MEEVGQLLERLEVDYHVVSKKRHLVVAKKFAEHTPHSLGLGVFGMIYSA